MPLRFRLAGSADRKTALSGACVFWRASYCLDNRTIVHAQMGISSSDNKTQKNVPGQADGPASPDSWKRAVYRLPPSRFTVEMLPPVKLGGSYNFQLRVCPITHGDRSSVSSRGSTTEYDILRRWEDCLIFQDTLEREYSRLAVSKRQRLLAGKGVRKNGVYLHSDKASSWESLPPGPEPDSVAQNIHDLVPRLTKKGTMFRASQATIDQRQAELTAFIAALWQENVPTLLEDFRKERTVTDFFGFWRRDQDIQKTANKSPSKPRSSVTSSVFSTYFSSDSSEDVTRRARAHSSASSDSSSALSSGSARSSIGSVQITLDDRPLAFGHNPHQATDNLEPLREDSEVSRKGRGGFLSAVSKRMRRTPADEAGRRGRRSLDEQPARPDSRASNATTINNRANRESWQTTASGMTFMNDLGLALPTDDADDESRSSRMSMASIATFRTDISSEGVMGVMPRYYVPEPNPARLSTATFMTDVSADAIIPRSPRRPDSRATLSQGSRGHQRTSSIVSDDESVMDEYFYDAFPRPCSFIPAPQRSRPGTPVPTKPHDSPSSPLPPTKFLEPTKVPLPTSPFPSAPPSPLVSDFQRSKSPSLSLTPDSPRIPVYPRKEFLARARSPSPNGSVMSASMSIMSEQSSFSDSTGSTITPSIYSFYSARSNISATTACSSSTASSCGASPLTIKAAHNDSIILLRAEADLSLGEMRRRLREKFLGQESVALSDSFSLVYMIPASPGKGGRTRSNSLSSASALSDASLVEKIGTEEDWARLRASLDGAKLTLRVVDVSS
ncbi:hypothetical protein DFH08DRAFT_930225 [Mycena albidolilacea]|uniref:PX domain-containing protein n=1 Tax=Mycena albidolilacea TaxID=1033008 RepID=A0AAD7ANM8_9AGAR|nr:hypothetical protein DFH08DRAFT_930225 [Mycena albidolilacea]